MCIYAMIAQVLIPITVPPSLEDPVKVGEVDSNEEYEWLSYSVLGCILAAARWLIMIYTMYIGGASVIYSVHTTSYTSSAMSCVISRVDGDDKYAGLSYSALGCIVTVRRGLVIVGMYIGAA